MRGAGPWALIGFAACGPTPERASAAQAPATPPASAPSCGASGAPKLTRISVLPAGSLAFDPTQARLAVDPGDPLRFYGPDGQVLSTAAVGGLATDLAFGSDGTLWAVLPAGIVRLDHDKVACKAEIEAQATLGVAPDGALWIGVQSWQDNGAYGALARVDAACHVETDAASLESPTAATFASDRTWLGTSARIAAGPHREAGPSLIVRQGAVELPRWPLFADRPDTQRVAGLAIGAGNVLALADTGDWELWTGDGKRRVAQGSAPGARLVSWPGTGIAALGDHLVDLATGQITAGVLPAPVLAISSDAALWVLGTESDRALWGCQGW